MSLILTVLSFKSQSITEIAAVSIGAEGGSIGRSVDNTLVLPDTEKFVSRHHATIKMENGCYYLSDTSLGGVYINSDALPLHNATVRLDNGTRLKVGEYEIAVAIVDDAPVVDDFPFTSESTLMPKHEPLVTVDEPWVELDSMVSNSLMTDNFPSHEELIQKEANTRPPDFQSRLAGNQSPLFDNYIAPSIIPSASPIPTSAETIPENFSFDDLFAEPDVGSAAIQAVNKSAVHDDFEDFFGTAISEMVAGNEISTEQHHETSESIDLFTDHEIPIEPVIKPVISEIPTEQHHEISESIDLFTDHEIPIEPVIKPVISEIPTEQHHHEISESVDLFTDHEIPIEPVIKPVISEIPTEQHHETSESVDLFTDHEILINKPAIDRVAQQKNHHIDEPSTDSHYEDKDIHAKPVLADNVLFDAFLQGVVVECDEVRPEQRAETLHRVGKMFRKLIDGTVAVLRSRAEFKSLCRVNMTVIKATNNNPLKFTVSTDDVLRQLIENKTDGFLASTDAIEEAFNDIMNHQLAMQAGIQASLTDLLKTFDPQIIEKQFEQGIVLQKKSKCWDRYEETYRNTVEDAVENFFGEEFVKAYEKQMSLLTKSRRK